MRRRLVSLGIGLLVAGAASAWVLATEHRERAPVLIVKPIAERKWPLTAGRAGQLRHAALAQAQVRLSVPAAPAIDLDVEEPALSCRFIAELPSGTSPKFDCMLPGGEVVKVKYGRNPEVPAEVAATRLLSALGFPADRMSIAPLVRCYGCPRNPFFAMHLLQLAGLHGRFPAYGSDSGYSEFEWVAIERKFDAAAIDLPDRKGWAWWELDRINPSRGASRADVDALRLLAIFLAHWDNKSENQRLVCLDAPGGADQACARPLAMLQDLGATFGPTKANLARWRSVPVWADAATCAVSMAHMPWHGGTFPDARISESGRRRLAAQLSAIPSHGVRALFRAARFPQHYSSTDDEKDLDEWTAAFRARVDHITGTGPCPQ